jgi:hypothetical protein
VSPARVVVLARRPRVVLAVRSRDDRRAKRFRGVTRARVAIARDATMETVAEIGGVECGILSLSRAHVTIHPSASTRDDDRARRARVNDRHDVPREFTRV